MFTLKALLVTATFAVALAAGQEQSEKQFVPNALLDTSTCTSGRRQGNACCKSTCAVCGGPDCNIDGMGNSCCVTKIRQLGRDCRFNLPPCVIPQISPSPVSKPSDPFCQTGIVGTRFGKFVCCPKSCGLCGGAMCGKAPGGASSCCIPAVLKSSKSCNVDVPPCVLSGAIPSSSKTPVPSTTPTTTASPLPSTTSSDPFCSNGIVGSNLRGTVCCPKSCGTCGGPMCATFPGGRMSCCIYYVLKYAKSCATTTAPCVAPVSPVPSKSPLPVADPLCLTGIKGTRSQGSVCCTQSCGRCGGSMCAKLPGGVDNCCIPKILDSSKTCDKNLPPCVIVPATPTPTATVSVSPTTSATSSKTPTVSPSPLTADPRCVTGIFASRSFGSVCCLASCGRCGGSNCATRPGGVGGCCIPRILQNAPSCLNALPPCVITSPSPTPSVTATMSPTVTATSSVTPTPTPSPTGADPACDFGIIGSSPNLGTVCCTTRCGTCGGPFCGTRPGGVSECCISRIIRTQPLCSNAVAPCVISAA